jgi:hypothetical protein
MNRNISKITSVKQFLAQKESTDFWVIDNNDKLHYCHDGFYSNPQLSGKIDSIAVVSSGLIVYYADKNAEYLRGWKNKTYKHRLPQNYNFKNIVT